ncbi:hypothetical protein OKJ48_00905 [Streptomyces kunmingensis]|uniref:Uncharacterized protein n=1 Tax=Streptomyces kunmingensis TaxID=68225 RepID=A0ABU6C2B2_9ACTN|nr:hypothetical protein [Streptomyces kunmingensis]MEB3958823.1 hypothetical protein [Streptomyces kunmingensis]
MEQHQSGGVSAAFAAFVSAMVSLVLTIAGTLVGLRSSASQAALFLVLTWLLIAASLATALVAGWLVADSIRKSTHELAHLRDLEAYVPRLIRFRRRHDSFVIAGDGNATLKISCDVEAPDADVVPWISFPMIAEVPQDQPSWTSISVRRVCVDGVDADPSIAFIRRERKIPADAATLDGRLVESGAVRVPVSLDTGRRRCSFIVELELLNAFSFIGHEEKCYTDVSYVTDHLEVTITGYDGLRVSFSPYAHTRVEAQQLGMEMPDAPESQLQSRYCQATDGVRWRTEQAKLGYRYAIPVRGLP